MASNVPIPTLVVLAFVLWGHVSYAVLAGWLALIVVNQALRGALAQAWRRRIRIAVTTSSAPAMT